MTKFLLNWRHWITNKLKIEIPNKYLLKERMSFYVYNNKDCHYQFTAKMIHIVTKGRLDAWRSQNKEPTKKENCTKCKPTRTLLSSLSLFRSHCSLSAQRNVVGSCRESQFSDLCPRFLINWGWDKFLIKLRWGIQVNSIHVLCKKK